MENYVKPEIVNLKNHPNYNEKWVQAKIEADPTILNLGDLELRDSERIQPSGRRLDLLLFDPGANRRYEVEIQLGKCDESHIIRTIEYWDTERKRFPQYDHCAVIIAEEITSQLLNIISLFNGFIPLIAIQMKAIKVGDSISLFFTKVLEEIRLGLEEEDEKAVVDRNYWEAKSSKDSLKIVDNLLKFINEFAPGYVLKYTKYYIGLAKDGVTNNYVSFTPKQNSIILYIKLNQTNEIDQLIEKEDLDSLTYDRQWNQYKIKLREKDIAEKKDVLIQMMKQAYDFYIS